MLKLKLNPEEIRVNGFDVLPAGETGKAEMMITAYTQCQQDTCWNGSCGTGVPCRQCP